MNEARPAVREELVERIAKRLQDQERVSAAWAAIIARACLSAIEAAEGMVILEREMIVDVFTEARESGLIGQEELEEVLGPLAPKRG